MLVQKTVLVLVGMPLELLFHRNDPLIYRPARQIDQDETDENYEIGLFHIAPIAPFEGPGHEEQQASDNDDKRRESYWFK